MFGMIWGGDLKPEKLSLAALRCLGCDQKRGKHLINSRGPFLE